MQQSNFISNIFAKKTNKQNYYRFDYALIKTFLNPAAKTTKLGLTQGVAAQSWLQGPWVWQQVWCCWWVVWLLRIHSWRLMWSPCLSLQKDWHLGPMRVLSARVCQKLIDYHWHQLVQSRCWKMLWKEPDLTSFICPRSRYRNILKIFTIFMYLIYIYIYI